MTERVEGTDLGHRQLIDAANVINEADRSRRQTRTEAPAVGLLNSEVREEDRIGLRVGELLYMTAMGRSDFRDTILKPGESAETVFGGPEDHPVTPQKVLTVIGDRADKRTVTRIVKATLTQAKTMRLNGDASKVNEALSGILSEIIGTGDSFQRVAQRAQKVSKKEAEQGKVKKHDLRNFTGRYGGIYYEKGVPRPRDPNKTKRKARSPRNGSR